MASLLSTTPVHSNAVQDTKSTFEIIIIFSTEVTVSDGCYLESSVFWKLEGLSLNIMQSVTRHITVEI